MEANHKTNISGHYLHDSFDSQGESKINDISFILLSTY